MLKILKFCTILDSFFSLMVYATVFGERCLTCKQCLPVFVLFSALSLCWIPPVCLSTGVKLSLEWKTRYLMCLQIFKLYVSPFRGIIMKPLYFYGTLKRSHGWEVSRKSWGTFYSSGRAYKKIIFCHAISYPNLWK